MTMNIFSIERLKEINNYPFINSRTTDTEIEYKIPTPGIIEDSIDLALEEKFLHVVFKMDSDRAWLNKGEYKHTLSVKGVDSGGITCEYDNGVLAIHMPLEGKK